MMLATFFAVLCSQTVFAQFMTEMPAAMGAALVADRQVVFDDLPEHHIAFNPSMVQYHGQTIMVFRRDHKPGRIALQTQLAIAPLDANFQPTQPHQALDTRVWPGALHAAEDPRLFVYHDALYVVFNQTPDGTAGGLRKIYLGKINVDYDAESGFQFSMAGFSRLDVPLHGVAQRPEKNWVPLIGDDAIRIAYWSDPLRIFRLPEARLDDLANHQDIMLEAEAPQAGDKTQLWSYGDIRGGTPAISDGHGHYLAFYHSSLEGYLRGRYGRVYVMGAYTFDARPPYAICALTTQPALPPGFFEPDRAQLIAFPGGIFESDGLLHVAYGAGDEAIYVVDIDKDLLLGSMSPIAGCNQSVP